MVFRCLRGFHIPVLKFQYIRQHLPVYRRRLVQLSCNTGLVGPVPIKSMQTPVVRQVIEQERGKTIGVAVWDVCCLHQHYYFTIDPYRSKSSARSIWTFTKRPGLRYKPSFEIKTSLSTSGESNSVRPIK